MSWTRPPAPADRRGDDRDQDPAPVQVARGVLEQDPGRDRQVERRQPVVLGEGRVIAA